MRTNEQERRGWGVAVGTLALLALTTGTALAAAPSTTAYRFSSHPMISGTVVTVNDHQMVVDTDQGERITLEVDSRTMAPRDLAPGMVMRAEFLALEDCRFHAQRIVPIRGGMSTHRRQAYANTGDSGEVLSGDAPAFGNYRGEGSEGRTRAEGRENPQWVGDRSAVMTATTATADYRFSSRPMISGRVLSVNDHWLVVETDQGQRVGLVMDSRTMVPREVAPGTVLRAEFTPMKDGRYYAKRISRIGSEVADREQAYAHTRDDDMVVAGNPSDCGFVSATTGNAVASVVERRGEVVPPDAVVAQVAPAPAVEDPETLPQTASHQPLVLLLGLLALGSAGLVTIARRLRIVSPSRSREGAKL